jgi:acetoin:2,6-dichlorophenolindophenol oxidoreductase subunit alpha
VVYVCENNLYGEWTPMAAVTAGGSIAQRAAAYAIPGVQVDGNDLWAMRAVAREAIARARRGLGPTLLEGLTYRQKGHSRLDTGTRYRPAEEIEAWLANDPLRRVAKQLDPGIRERIREEAAAEVARAVEAARAGAWPDAKGELAASATKGPT